MNITKEQAEAIRCADEIRFVNIDRCSGQLTFSGLPINADTILHLLRLGVCVLESGVTARDVAEMADAVDGEQDPRLAAMLDALATELEASR